MTQTDAHTCAQNGHTAAGQGVCLWSSRSGSPAAAAPWVCQVSVRGHAWGLNDGRMGGGRDGSRLMCRQRRSLLCVGEAHKAAFSVCAGTEGPPFSGHGCFLSELGESSSHQRGDATSFSSHYVLIRGCYRGGGEDQEQAGMLNCARRDHKAFRGCPSAAGLRAALKLSAHG